jgi:prepilin-type N-terminal cleavage/methylation domain-containing protein
MGIDRFAAGFILLRLNLNHKGEAMAATHARIIAKPCHSAGFTLVELLIVIGIIAVLVSILLPSLSRARQAAVMVKSLSNLRQLGLGLEMYKNENKGAFPVAAWPSVPGAARMRWADYLYPLIRNTEVFMSPALDSVERARMRKPFAHTCDPATGATLATTLYWGATAGTA